MATAAGAVPAAVPQVAALPVLPAVVQVLPAPAPTASVQAPAQALPFAPLLNPTQDELTAIANCNLSTHLIAIKYDASSSKIVTIARTDVTCWQLFLRVLGWGKFAKTDFSLKKVTNGLSTYNWRQFASNTDTSSVDYRAYFTMCKLASKALHAKDRYSYSRRGALDSLWRNVSTGVERPITLLLIQHARENEQRVSAQRHIFFNPIAQVKHIKRLLSQQFHPAQIRIEDAATNEALNDDAYVNTEAQVRNINIFVRQRISAFPSSLYDA